MIVPSVPVFATIELTPYCNNRCAGCGNVFVGSHVRRSQLEAPLSLKQWKSILLKLKSCITRLDFTGGEPSLHPAFEEILYFTAELDISFAIFTNGRWIEPRQLLEFLRDIPQFQGMLVSLHGASPDTHEVFTGIRGSFQETTANIRLAVEAGLMVNTNTVITSHNYDQVEQIVDFVHTLGVSTAIIARYIGKPVPEIEVTPKQLKQAVEVAEQKRQEGSRVKFSACIPQCFAPSSAYACTAGYTFFTIDPWGNVRPCNHAPLLCGNLLQQSVASIWHSEPMERWRNSVPVECKSCSAFSWCHGGCHAEAMAHGLVADPLMGEPISDYEPSVQPHREITLGKTDLPVMYCQVRPESFGYLLIRGTHTALVSHEAWAILDACDGTVTFEEIRERFGQKGLDLVGALVERGFIELLAS